MDSNALSQTRMMLNTRSSVTNSAKWNTRNLYPAPDTDNVLRTRADIILKFNVADGDFFVLWWIEEFRGTILVLMFLGVSRHVLPLRTRHLGVHSRLCGSFTLAIQRARFYVAESLVVKASLNLGQRRWFWISTSASCITAFEYGNSDTLLYLFQVKFNKK